MENQKTNRDMAIADIKTKKAKAYSMLMIKQSELFNLLDSLSHKTEEKLTKKDLFRLIVKNCDYMKAKSIYEYWCSCFRKEILGEE